MEKRTKAGFIITDLSKGFSIEEVQNLAFSLFNLSNSLEKSTNSSSGMNILTPSITTLTASSGILVSFSTISTTDADANVTK